MIKIKSQNTVNLLKILHNGREGKDLKLKAKNIQALINQKADQLSDLIIKWKTENLNENLKKQISELLSKKSAFTLLLRSMSIC